MDKFYPSNVYGFNVYVWADTGEVCYINERVCTLDPPEDLVATYDKYVVEPVDGTLSADEAKVNSVELKWLVFPAFATAILSIFLTRSLVDRKKNLSRTRSFKVGSVLLCILLSSILLVPVFTVNAVEPTRRATIWGSESAGDTSFWNGTHWVTGRKTADEIEWQRWISSRISDYFKHDGYIASNYQGTNSLKYEIVGDASHQGNVSYNEQNYANVAVVDFDHGVGRPDYIEDPEVFHYMFEDNIGKVTDVAPDGTDPNNWVNTNMVYDMDIYDDTDGKTFFAFINTCLSADLEYQDDTGDIQGMPLAWTHRVVDTVNPGSSINTAVYMSDDGYGDPDTGDFCYLGFPWGSAALDQTITGSSYEYVYWVQDVFYYALSIDISVNDALDEASQIRFYNNDFNETRLGGYAGGFYAVWPMWNPETEEWDDDPYPTPGKLAVYGNGEIHLFEYFVREYLSATGAGYGGVDNPDNIEGGSNDGQYTRIYAYTYPPIYSQAVLRCRITEVATGHIYFYGYTTTPTDILVYVSYDDSNWDLVNSFNLWDSSPGWRSVGSYNNDFQYIAIVVYPTGNLYVDSVLVIPPI